MNHRHLILLCLYCACCLSAIAVRAQPTPSSAIPAGEALAEVARYRGWEVSSFTVNGLGPRMTTELRSGLALNGRRSLVLIRRPLLFRDVLADDLQRTRIYMAQNGFPRAEIQVVFQPDRKDRKVGLTLRIAPGLPVLVEKVTITGVPNDIKLPHFEAGLLSTGDRFLEADLQRAIVLQGDALAEAGHPRATIRPFVSLSDSTHASVRLDVNPGPRCRFSDTVINGTPEDLHFLVLRNSRPDSGAIYTPELLRRARRNVRELDLFRRVDVRVSNPVDDKVDLIVDVIPRKPRSADLDLGYWSDDFLKAGARWRHRNLFSHGRGAEVKGTLSRYRRDGGVNVWWLSPFGPRTRLNTRLQYVMETEDSYDLSSAQAEIWASRRIGNIGQIQTGLTVADVTVDEHTLDPDVFITGDGLLTSLHLRLNNAYVNNPIDPTLGVSWSSRFEWSPAWLPTDNSFALAAGEIVRYRPLGCTTLATRLEGGIAKPLGGSADLLPNKRFFAGGATSMRGARRRMLGPLDSRNTPIGGEAMLIASAELRLRIKGNLRGALFVDVGNAWRYASQVTLNDLKVAVGPGLMFMTPVGPVRADAGYNLTSRPVGEPGVVLHIAIGHPF